MESQRRKGIELTQENERYKKKIDTLQVELKKDTTAYERQLKVESTSSNSAKKLRLERKLKDTETQLTIATKHFGTTKANLEHSRKQLDQAKKSMETMRKQWKQKTREAFHKSNYTIILDADPEDVISKLHLANERIQSMELALMRAEDSKDEHKRDSELMAIELHGAHGRVDRLTAYLQKKEAELSQNTATGKAMETEPGNTKGQLRLANER